MPTNSRLRDRLPDWLLSESAINYASGVVGLIVTVGSSIGTLYVALTNPTTASVPIVIAATFALILTAGISFLAFAYAQKIRMVKRQALQIATLQSEAVNQIRTYVANIENLNPIFTEFASGLNDGIGTAHLGLFVNRTKDIFDRISTSGQSAVCVKLLKYDPSLSEFGGHYLWTARRDDISSMTRSKTDHVPRLKRYAPDENKAFSDIMSRGVGRDHYVWSDLQSLGTGYFNSNPHWREFYNAVAVVPIKPCRADVLESTIGFLCVDSLHGKISEDVAVPTLVLIAEILYLHIQTHPGTLEFIPSTG